jgi:hypothetical protein
VRLLGLGLGLGLRVRVMISDWIKVRDGIRVRVLKIIELSTVKQNLLYSP